MKKFLKTIKSKLATRKLAALMSDANRLIEREGYTIMEIKLSRPKTHAVLETFLMVFKQKIAAEGRGNLKEARNYDRKLRELLKKYDKIKKKHDPA